jgi:HEPN domain-containing protein
METNSRELVRGWVNTATTELNAARGYLNRYEPVAAVMAAQVCVELSVKAVLVMLDIPFKKVHGWTEEQVGEMAKVINGRRLPERLKEHHLAGVVRLPRLLHRAGFWSEFYLRAKYGFETGHLAPAQELFEQEDAELAVRHANEVHRAAWALLHLAPEKLADLRRR